MPEVRVTVPQTTLPQGVVRKGQTVHVDDALADRLIRLGWAVPAGDQAAWRDRMYGTPGAHADPRPPIERVGLTVDAVAGLSTRQLRRVADQAGVDRTGPRDVLVARLTVG